jgi:lipoprotein-anchoring transpeptidase ErfK/SrfK
VTWRFPATRDRRTRLVASASGVLALVAVLASCTPGSTKAGLPQVGTPSSSASTSSAAATPSSASPQPSGPAVITASPSAGATGVDPVAPVSVSVTSGRLTSVVLTNPAGKQVSGAVSPSGNSWHTTEVLGYSKTYSLSATAVNLDGKVVVRKSSFTTLTPGDQTMPYLQRPGGYALTGGATYGVAIVPMVHFDEAITDKAAAQRALSVTTSPQVAGSWYWTDDSDVAYRPASYWPSGTKVTVNANVYGVEVGPNLYGESDVSTSFTIGRKQLTVADDNSPQIDKVYVYNAAGQVLRTMNTSMGQHGGETVNGNYINFYTLNGTYTVLEHDNPAIMSSASYGLPADDPHGYPAISVPFSTKISIDGIYLHEYNSTIYDQDHGLDVSEGCLNLQTSDAVWFYDNSIIGDPVVVHGAKGAPTIAVNEGGEWSVPWAAWLAGSALH